MNEAMILVGLIVLVGLVWLAWFWRWSSSAPVLERLKRKLSGAYASELPKIAPHVVGLRLNHLVQRVKGERSGHGRK